MFISSTLDNHRTGLNKPLMVYTKYTLSCHHISFIWWHYKHSTAVPGKKTSTGLCACACVALCMCSCVCKNETWQRKLIAHTIKAENQPSYYIFISNIKCELSSINTLSELTGTHVVKKNTQTKPQSLHSTFGQNPTSTSISKLSQILQYYSLLHPHTASENSSVPSKRSVQKLCRDLNSGSWPRN